VRCHGAALVLTAFVLAACGGSSSPAPKEVVRAWSDALDRGDSEAAAGLFEANARFVAGDSVQILKTHDEAVALNAEFRCAGRIARMARTAGYVTAMLAQRKAPGCGRGEWGSVDVRVRNGKIVELIQIGA
jgi:hypothetical protein